jgi:hypothetical protein
MDGRIRGVVSVAPMMDWTDSSGIIGADRLSKQITKWI